MHIFVPRYRTCLRKFYTCPVPVQVFCPTLIPVRYHHVEYHTPFIENEPEHGLG